MKEIVVNLGGIVPLSTVGLARALLPLCCSCVAALCAARIATTLRFNQATAQ